MGDRAAAIEFLNAAIANINDKSNPTHLSHALHLLSSACNADPTWAKAWFEVGNCHSELNQLQSAIACWRRGLQEKTDDELRSKLLNNLAYRCQCVGLVSESLGYAQECVELNQNEHFGWITLSVIYQCLNLPEKSYEAAARAFDLMPSDPTIEVGYAFSCLFSRRLALGFKHFESRFAYKLKNYLQLPYAKWNGEDGKTLFLDSDQGLGDTLCFARFVPLAAKKCKYIHCAVQPELLRLFTHAFVGLENVNVYAKPAPYPSADVWSTFVSLPYNLGLTDDEIRNTPQVPAPRVSMPQNWKVPDRKLHVGIAWAGSPLNDINVHRSIDVRQFYDLYRTPGVQLYGLQVGERGQDLYDTNGLALVRDLSRSVQDVVSTVGLLRQLDLVITCESALGHIASLAGVECWIPYSYLGRDYRLGLDGTDILWSPKHRTFNRQQFESWQPVFNRINTALEQRVEEQDARAA